MIVFDQTIKSTFESAAATVEQITSLLRDEYNLDRAVLFRVSFMLREIINNAVEHGNKFDESKTIHILVDLSEEALVFKIRDEGKGFTLEVLEQIPDHQLRVRNRGIFLIKEFGFEIDVVNQVVMVKLPCDIK